MGVFRKHGKILEKKKKEFHQELQWTRYYNQKQNLSFIVGNQKQKPILFYFFLIWEKKYVYTEKKKSLAQNLVSLLCVLMN